MYLIPPLLVYNSVLSPQPSLAAAQPPEQAEQKQEREEEPAATMIVMAAEHPAHPAQHRQRVDQAADDQHPDQSLPPARHRRGGRSGGRGRSGAGFGAGRG